MDRRRFLMFLGSIAGCIMFPVRKVVAAIKRPEPGFVFDKPAIVGELLIKLGESRCVSVRLKRHDSPVISCLIDALEPPDADVVLYHSLGLYSLGLYMRPGDRLMVTDSLDRKKGKSLDCGNGKSLECRIFVTMIDARFNTQKYLYQRKGE